MSNILKSMCFLVIAFVFCCCDGCGESKGFVAVPLRMPPTQCEGYRFSVGASTPALVVMVVDAMGGVLGTLIFDGSGARRVFNASVPDMRLLVDVDPLARPLEVEYSDAKLCLWLGTEDQSNDPCLAAMRGAQACVPLLLE